MIALRKTLLREIIKNCEEERPCEGCGILAGKNGRVEKVYRMKNVEKTPVSYLMDSKEQLYVIKDIRNTGMEMLGIYHSHVSSPARPSRKDVDMAFYTDVSYVIVSFEAQQPVVKSFKINGENVEEEVINIENE
ncbi:MAG: M67 family metallopeptidase [Candidatus Omnitrophica bacterium]|nr:M67 family metallopeptidase [Candidatus Omnitrophota bacterium]